MLDLFIKMNPSITVEDKKACEPMIAHLVKVSQLCRQEGILALDEFMETEEDDPFLKEAASYVTDGIDPELIRKRLSYMIFVSGETGAKLLKKFIVAEGILLIQSGVDNDSLQTTLGAMLGLEYLLRMRENLFTLSEFYKKLEDTHSDKKKSRFESEIQSIPDEHMRSVLQNMNYITICNAISILHIDTIHKIIDNLPPYMQKLVISHVSLVNSASKWDAKQAFGKLLGDCTF